MARDQSRENKSLGPWPDAFAGRSLTMEQIDGEGTVDTVNNRQTHDGQRTYAMPRSMSTIRYRQLPGARTTSLAERPGLQRFRNLPEPVAQRVLEFLEEVRASRPEYSGAYSRAWRDFLQRFSLIFFEPFESPRHFAARDVLSEDEFDRYAENLISALRPVLLALREPAAAESRGALELVVDSTDDARAFDDAMRA